MILYEPYRTRDGTLARFIQMFLQISRRQNAYTKCLSAKRHGYVGAVFSEEGLKAMKFYMQRWHKGLTVHQWEDPEQR